MTTDSKFFGPAPDVVGQAGGARFDAKLVSKQVWILEVRPLVDSPGGEVTGDMAVAVLQAIAAQILYPYPPGMPPDAVQQMVEFLGRPAPKNKRHLRVVSHHDPEDPEGGDAA